MKSEEKLKQLKMALTEHKDLIIVYENTKWLKLRWDDEEKNYRSKSYETNLEFGRWSLETLVQIINGKIEKLDLEVANG